MASHGSSLAFAAAGHLRPASNGEDSGSVPVGGRPVEEWELEDDAAGGGENLLDSCTFKDWIRLQPDRNLDPGLVPDAAVADYLGGTVSFSAKRPGSALESCLCELMSDAAPIAVCSETVPADRITMVISTGWPASGGYVRGVSYPSEGRQHALALQTPSCTLSVCDDSTQCRGQTHSFLLPAHKSKKSACYRWELNSGLLQSQPGTHTRTYLADILSKETVQLASTPTCTVIATTNHTVHA